MSYLKNNAEKLRVDIESIWKADDETQAAEIKAMIVKWFEKIVLESYRNGIKTGKIKNAPKQQEEFRDNG